MLTATGVNIRYGQQSVLDDLHLIVEAGAELALTGRSGSGKTTLLLVLAGLIAPASGALQWPGLAVDRQHHRGHVGVIFQAPSLIPELTALQNVSLPLRLRGYDQPAAREASEVALRRMGLTDADDALPHQLSGGMQQRVAAARALAGTPRLVLADEPTGALDRRSAFVVLNALREAVACTGGTLIMATHDEELAAELDTRLYLSGGRLSEPSR